MNTAKIDIVYGFWLSSLREYKVTEQGDDYLKIKDKVTLRLRDGAWVDSWGTEKYFATQAEAIDHKLAQCRESIRRATAAIKHDEKTIVKLAALKKGLSND